jgi:uncharacterized protein GlcG (DUF336 family)
MKGRDNVSYDLNKIIDGVVKEVLSSDVGKVNKGSVSSNLNSMEKMTLICARKIIRAVQTKAKEMGVKAVCAVSDAGGNPIAVECMDDAFIASYDIAVNKAYTVVALKMPTKDLASLAAPGGSLYGIQFTGGGKIVIFGGGEPLKNKNGVIIGGFGVSGGTAEQDTKLGEYAKQCFESMAN